MRIDELWWDEGSEEHITRHGVLPEEVDEAVFDRRARFRRVGKDRYAALGSTGTGRHLFVILHLLPTGSARVVTARDMSDREKRRFRRRP